MLRSPWLIRINPGDRVKVSVSRLSWRLAPTPSRTHAMISYVLLLLALLSVACSGSAQSVDDTPDWGYSGTGGPANWAGLSEQYSACSDGVKQSPVDITGYSPGTADPISFAYRSAAVGTRNSSRTVYLDYGPGNSIDVGGEQYELKGIHFHSPSEHLLNGESFAAELYLVHQNADHDSAVVGLLFRLGAPSPLVQNLINAASGTGAAVDLADYAASDYIPSRLDYYAYEGSLTTPPCAEGVRWMVMQSIGAVSQEQVHKLQELSGGPNNRPPQPIGKRAIIAVSFPP